MAIELKVARFRGQAPAQTQQITVDELGAKIGRSPACALALEDPGRSVSREQAEVVCRNQTYVLIDRGSNPTHVNGRPLGQGASVELRIGDTITVGEYDIEVAQVASNPLAGLDLFGSGGASLSSGSGHANSSTTGATTPSTSGPWGSALDDDWDFLAPPAAAAPAAPSGPASAGSSGSVRPSASDPLGLGLDLSGGHIGGSGGSDPSIDDLFGLGGAPAPASVRPDAAAAAFAPAKADDFDDLFGDLAPAKPATASADPFDFGERMPTINEPMPPLRAATAPTPLVPKAPAPMNLDTAGGSQDVWAAFESGLGFSLGGGADADKAKRCGQMLRNCLDGTQKLLQARAVFKRELRAEMTVIMARENNPLKLSPSVDAALSLLLSDTVNGYKSADAATREALDDLLSHQAGMVAGVKAALESLLQQFNPTQLESQFSKQSLLGNILPGAKKARAWEVFCETYGTLSQEAADNFQKVFGEAFLKAYEQQMNDLSKQRS